MAAEQPWWTTIHQENILNVTDSYHSMVTDVRIKTMCLLLMSLSTSRDKNVHPGINVNMNRLINQCEPLLWLFIRFTIFEKSFCAQTYLKCWVYRHKGTFLDYFCKWDGLYCFCCYFLVNIVFWNVKVVFIDCGFFLFNLLTPPPILDLLFSLRTVPVYAESVTQPYFIKRTKSFEKRYLWYFDT